MTSIIGFLEISGREGQASLEAHRLLLGIAPELRGAIVAGDVTAIRTLETIPVIHSCYISAPTDEPVPAEAPEETPAEPDQQDAEAA